MEKIKKNIEFIVGLVGLLGIFYSIIMFIYNKTYQQDCEEFYKIPAKYFEGDLNEKNSVYSFYYRINGYLNISNNSKKSR